LAYYIYNKFDTVDIMEGEEDGRHGH
jgi:hypothetical protein